MRHEHCAVFPYYSYKMRSLQIIWPDCHNTPETKLSLIADADEAVLDKGKLTGRIHGVTKALDLIGPRN